MRWDKEALIDRIMGGELARIRYVLGETDCVSLAIAALDFGVRRRMGGRACWPKLPEIERVLEPLWGQGEARLLADCRETGVFGRLACELARLDAGISYPPHRVPPRVGDVIELFPPGSGTLRGNIGVILADGSVATWVLVAGDAPPTLRRVFRTIVCGSPPDGELGDRAPYEIVGGPTGHIGPPVFWQIDPVGRLVPLPFEPRDGIEPWVETRPLLTAAPLRS